jgi:hypothetical protein
MPEISGFQEFRARWIVALGISRLPGVRLRLISSSTAHLLHTIAYSYKEGDMEMKQLRRSDKQQAHANS